MAPEFIIAAWGFAALLGLIVLRAPIALSMMLVGALGYVHILDWSALLNYLKSTPYHLFANYTLSVIPLFILMGALAERGGLARDLFAAANAVMGVIAWRMTLGGLEAMANGTRTIGLLALPYGWAIAVGAACFGLTALIALTQVGRRADDGA